MTDRVFTPETWSANSRGHNNVACKHTIAETKWQPISKTRHYPLRAPLKEPVIFDGAELPLRVDSGHLTVHHWVPSVTLTARIITNFHAPGDVYVMT